jgi:glycosyltransferase involved in cell wall biosynthesis
MDSNQTDIQVETLIAPEKNIKKQISLSVILALNNSSEILEELLENLEQSLTKIDGPFEIICVDDGSTDDTSSILKKTTEKNEHIKLIKMRSVFGEASVLDAGIKLAKGDKILYFTSRVRINPLQVPNLIKPLENGYDLVVGWRHPRRDSKLNHIVSKFFNFMINKVASLKLHDINSGIFAAKKEVLENISLYGDLNNFVPVLATKQGYKVTEEQIEQLPGWFRTSRYPSEYIRRFLDIITVFFLTRYSKKPIHFLGFVGAVFTLSGLAINLYLFIYRILQIGPIAGRPMLLLGALLLIIGIQMVSIGLIGEMIIFTHAKEVKEYNIEEIVQ